MEYRTGSSRGGQKFQKSQHEKKKAKTHKPVGKNKQVLEERQNATAEEIANRTLNSLKRLGDQKFAVSPFSQYFGDWLASLSEVLSEFEANPNIDIDETFAKEREQVIAKAEQGLTELRKQEATLNQAVRDLADNNHLLVEIDDEYATQTRELGPERNAEIKSLTLDVTRLEEELERVKATKTSFFGAFTKRVKRKKEEEIQQKLVSAKKAVESVVQHFKSEQEKLHDDYEKKKQTIIAKVQSLEREVEKLETDESLVVRKATSEALINAVNELFQRKSTVET
ncbi:MAG TPA: hypothetical protein VF893_01330 [Candidatus Bathyarchaeia archaeon]